jgi:hypothetical protein
MFSFLVQEQLRAITVRNQSIVRGINLDARNTGSEKLTLFNS